jgi:signal transduction histidine kinase
VGCCLGGVIFNRKDFGKGTGSGLNMSNNIIKKHNDATNVESEVNHGTTFTINSPAVQQKTTGSRLVL